MSTAVTPRFARTLPTKGQPRPGTLIERFKLWLDLHAERRALAKLDPRMLADIGITEGQAHREAMRAPWDVPVVREEIARTGAAPMPYVRRPYG
ncbi:MAG: DUF1127 domain-containing protein [Pseudomonadota bacterium]